MQYNIYIYAIYIYIHTIYAIYIYTFVCVCVCVCVCFDACACDLPQRGCVDTKNVDVKRVAVPLHNYTSKCCFAAGYSWICQCFPFICHAWPPSFLKSKRPRNEMTMYQKVAKIVACRKLSPLVLDAWCLPVFGGWPQRENHLQPAPGV